MNDHTPIILGVAGVASNLPSGMTPEQLTFAGMTGFFIWWVTQSLSKRLDALGEKIDRLGERIDKDHVSGIPK